MTRSVTFCNTGCCTKLQLHSTKRIFRKLKTLSHYLELNPLIIVICLFWFSSPNIFYFFCFVDSYFEALWLHRTFAGELRGTGLDEFGEPVRNFAQSEPVRGTGCRVPRTSATSDLVSQSGASHCMQHSRVGSCLSVQQAEVWGVVVVQQAEVQIMPTHSSQTQWCRLIA